MIEAEIGGAVWADGGRVALSQTTLKDNDAGIEGDGDGLVRYDRGAYEVLAHAEPPLFADGFETGDVSGWSSVLP